MKYIITLLFLVIGYVSFSQSCDVDSIYSPKKFMDVRHYEDGSIREVGNHDFFERRHGEFYAFYPNGNISGYGQFKHGKKHGMWKTYAPDGVLIGIYHYRNGERHGDWFVFNHDGMLITEKRY